MEIFGPFLYALVVFVSTMAGSVLTVYGSEWIKKHSSAAMSFSAGILLAVAFMRLIPEAQSLGKSSVYAFIIGGFLAFYIIENLFMYHPCPEEECDVHTISALSAIGLSAHSLVDGIAIAAVFAVNFELGMILTLGVLFHKLSDGIVITCLLLYAGNSKRKTLLFSFCIALLTPVGALISSIFIRGVSCQFLGSLLGIVAGMFIYLATADLIPQTHSEKNKANILVLLSGVLLIVVVGMLFRR